MARSRFDNLEEEKQEKILSEAGEEFAAKGYAEASLNAIIERAGISKGSLYYYFDNKEDLFGTAVEVAIAKLLDVVGGFDIEGLTAENFWEEIDRFTLRVVEYADRNRWYYQLGRTFYRVRDDSEAGGATAKFFEMSQSIIRRVIGRGQELGVVREDMPMDFMVEIVMAVGEAQDRWVLSKFDEMEREELEEEILREMNIYRRILEPEEERA